MSKDYRYIYADQLAGKRQFNFYLATAECPLTTPENLVLSYLVYKNKFDSPKTNEVCRWTGLSDKTVSAAITTIAGVHGLLGMEGKLPPATWHYKQNKFEGEAFYRYTKHFTFYSPSAGGPLSVNDCLVWCWLYNNYACNRSEWKVRYISACLKLDHRTVQHSLERLDELKLVRNSDDTILFPERLTRTHLGYFGDKGKELKTSGTFSVADDDNLPPLLNLIH